MAVHGLHSGKSSIPSSPGPTPAASVANAAPARDPPEGPRFRGARKRRWGRYVSEIWNPYTKTTEWLGTFGTAEEAARAFDNAARRLRGPNAKTNFSERPRSNPDPRIDLFLGPPAIEKEEEEEKKKGLQLDLNLPPPL